MKDGASHYTFHVRAWIEYFPRGGMGVGDQFNSSVDWAFGTSLTLRWIGRLGQQNCLRVTFFVVGLQRESTGQNQENWWTGSTNTRYFRYYMNCLPKEKCRVLCFSCCWSVCNILEASLKSDTTWWCMGLKMIQELQQYSIPFTTYRVI
jgi:hypothetical protein